ncbi:hypothetical protein N790_03090 [Arenimonas malthae CC-JY-1]|uniref:Uncharacterized protein n=1 Tax=Arenimonas malthae CC-JY-1 TaxID=1384054 RepID=A0A091ANP8_9GAMM|nr:hypothetical protein N790_03090 [Arenimonas malthae CC-JY-1]
MLIQSCGPPEGADPTLQLDSFMLLSSVLVDPMRTQ